MGKMRLRLTSHPRSTCSASGARGLSILELVVSLAIMALLPTVVSIAAAVHSALA